MKNLFKYLTFLLIFLFYIIINNLEIKAQRLCDDYFTQHYLNNIYIHNQQIDQMAENSVAVNPNNPNIVLSASQTNSHVVAFVSSDWGNTWSGGNIDQNNPSCDPSVAIDLNNRLYVSYLLQCGGGYCQKVALSDDFGSNWNFILISNNSTTDKDFIHIDNCCSSPYKGHVYCAWSSASLIYISYSINGGNNWSTPVSIGAAEDKQLGVNITTDRDGYVYVVWGIYTGYGSDIWNKIGLSISYDGGQNWNLQPEIQLSRTASQGTSCEGPSITCNLSNYKLSMVYSGTTDFINYDVFLLTSLNRGINWDDGGTVNQDLTRNQLYPWISCDPVTGYLAIIYYDTREGSPLNPFKNTYFSISTNFGVSWCDMKISSSHWNGNATVHTDYIGIEFNKGIIYPIWSDTRDAVTKTYIQPYFVLPKDSTIQDQTINGNHELIFSAEELTTNNFIINSGGSITLESVNSITLNPGFEALSGSNFIADLIYCNPPIYNNKKYLSFKSGNENIENVNKVNNLPDKFFLEQNYPNPFNPNTLIKYGLKKNSFVSLKIYNILGQLVKTLIYDQQDAGFKNVVWDGTNNSSIPVSTGLYIYKITASDFIETKKMVLIR